MRKGNGEGRGGEWKGKEIKEQEEGEFCNDPNFFLFMNFRGRNKLTH